MIFTFATFATNGAALPIGYTLDTIGPRKTSIIGAVIFLLGNLLFGLGYRSSCAPWLLPSPLDLRPGH